jgi:hypothetical protein
VKIKTIIVASALLLVSVQANAASPDTVPADASEVAAWSELSYVAMPSAFWLFGAALLGFVSFSRRTNVS